MMLVGTLFCALRQEAEVTVIVCGQWLDHVMMFERLAPPVEAGFMPRGHRAGVEGAQRSVYF